MLAAMNTFFQLHQSGSVLSGLFQRHWLLAIGLSVFLFAGQASARINLVTLPGRDSVQLTIYNSVDLTMVKETRILTFRKGINALEFSWANTLIDPTSVEFRPLTHADAVEVLDVRFPPRAANTLEWRIQSEFAGEVEVEIRYFTSGISWQADYAAIANSHENQMKLSAAVRVRNNSGEDYENAQVRLIVGVIKLVEQIADLSRTADNDERVLSEKLAEKPAAPGNTPRRGLAVAYGGAVDKKDAMMLGRKMEIAKEALSEYFMYTVEGRDTIPAGWSKMLPSFETEEVPITSFYKFENERWGDKVMRYYRFKNDQASKLGKEPLPNGSVQALRQLDQDQRFYYVGGTAVKYIPINEQVDLELGFDPEIMVKPRLMNWEKTNLQYDSKGNITGWTIRQSWEIEMQNSKTINATLDIRRNFQGDWSVEEASGNYEKVDASKIKILVPLKSGEKQVFKYKAITRHGTNVTR